MHPLQRIILESKPFSWRPCFLFLFSLLRLALGAVLVEMLVGRREDLALECPGNYMFRTLCTCAYDR